MGARTGAEQRDIIWAAGGCVLLALLLLRAAALSLGAPGAKLAVGAVFCLLAVLALWLSLRGGGAALPAGLMFFLVAAALFLRLFLLEHQTYDYQDFLAPWAAWFRNNGGLAALADPVGNYNVPYLVFLALISYLPVPDLYLIKLFSILFDVLLAWGGQRLAARFSPADSLRPSLAFLLLLLLPTVVLNGAYWGQCDSLYAALCLHALACGLERRGGRSVLLLSLAFSFKLQTVFLIPVWCLLWYARRIAFRHLLLFPAGYLAAILPALLAGRGLGSILGIYLGQAGEYSALVLNAPSLFALLPAAVQNGPAAGTLSKLGVLAAFLLVLALLAAPFPRRRQLSDWAILLTAAAMALGIPLLLPHMHERYFFLADCLVLLLALLGGRQFWAAALLVQVASLGGYHAYLRLRYAFPMGLGALLNLAALLLVLAALSGALSPPPRRARRAQ